MIAIELGALCVRVEDDGAGSLPEGGGDGWGILGLVERARALGGEVVLSRRKQGDGGTRTVLEAILSRPVTTGRFPAICSSAASSSSKTSRTVSSNRSPAAVRVAVRDPRSNSTCP